MRSATLLTASSLLALIAYASCANARMNDGDYDSLQIIGRDGIRVSVSLTQTDWHNSFGPFGGWTTTDDPGWIIQKQGATINYPKISVVATDGTVRNLGVTCTYNSNVNPIGAPPHAEITCQFRISQADSDDDDRDDATFWFRDPDDGGTTYCARLLPVESFPGTPRFRVKHSPC